MKIRRAGAPPLCFGTGMKWPQTWGILCNMPSTIKQTVTVRSGGGVEIHSPELHEGDQADVTVVVTRPPNGNAQNSQPGGWRRYAGAVNRKDAQAADNHRIDANLADEYGGGSNPVQ